VRQILDCLRGRIKGNFRRPRHRAERLHVPGFGVVAARRVDLTRTGWTRDRFEELVPMTPRMFSVCLAARLAVTGYAKTSLSKGIPAN
jgi:hypothetical protein